MATSTRLLEDAVTCPPLLKPVRPKEEASRQGWGLGAAGSLGLSFTRGTACTDCSPA